MQTISQMLLNNAGQRLTTELINGMGHTIKTEFDKLASELEQANQRIAELESQYGLEQEDN